MLFGGAGKDLMLGGAGEVVVRFARESQSPRYGGCAAGNDCERRGGMKTEWIGVLVAAILLSACEKARLDQEVDRLCRIDGGIRVYETVKLSMEDYDERRGIVFPQYANLPGDKGRYGNLYYSSWETKTIVSGDPELVRSHLKIVRKSDEKILGEHVTYFRRGGDIPNPFHPSSYGCPRVDSTPDLVKQVFSTGDGK